MCFCLWPGQSSVIASSLQKPEPSEPVMYTLLHVQIHSYRRLGLFWIDFTKIAQCSSVPGGVYVLLLLFTEMRLALPYHGTMVLPRSHLRLLGDRRPLVPSALYIVHEQRVRSCTAVYSHTDRQTDRQGTSKSAHLPLGPHQGSSARMHRRS